MCVVLRDGARSNTEAAPQAEEPRLKFKGVLEVNPDTGRQQMVAESGGSQALKKLVGFLVVLLMIVLTICAGTLAMLLRYAGDDPCAGLDAEVLPSLDTTHSTP